VSDALVDVGLDGAVAVLSLRREAKLNALSSALEGALDAAIDRPDVRASACVVITGGPRAFSAGADVGELRDLDPAAILAYYRATGGVYERVARLPQPTISAIAGHCLGGGFELALATDFRVAETSASFGLPEVGIGILPSSGGTHRLTRLIGTARTKELVLLGDRFGAEDAHRLGLVTEVVAEGESLPRALALADRIAALPPLAVSVAKQVIDALPGTSDEAGLALERLAYGMLAQTPEHRDATQAFTDKRR
jgi:enoyl-CoA hydratase/carnithine racemase